MRRRSEMLEALNAEMDNVIADDPEMYGTTLDFFVYGYRLAVSDVARAEVPSDVLDAVCVPIARALTEAGMSEEAALAAAREVAPESIRRAWVEMFNLRPGEPGGARKPRPKR